MPVAATIEDVIEISKAEALKAGRKIIGLTVSEPRYVSVPDDADPGAQFEFVVDVQLLDGVSQAVTPGATGAGLAVVENVLISHEAVGEIIADIHVPVEIEKAVTGQLQVVNRAKVQLPSLSVKALSYRRLKMEHVAELDIRESGAFDPFGNPVDVDAELDGAVVGLRVRNSFQLNTLDQLAKNNAGQFVGLGVNPLQRVIQETIEEWTVEAKESIGITESALVT